jgi:hypothetical protein
VPAQATGRTEHACWQPSGVHLRWCWLCAQCQPAGMQHCAAHLRCCHAAATVQH